MNYKDILWRNDFLKYFLLIQVLFFTVIASSYMGLDIPILRQIISFIYIAFVPGFVILRIFRLKNLDYTSTILFSFGLSLSFLMITGVLMSLIYPLFGVTQPLSFDSILITLTISIIILALISCIRNKNSNGKNEGTSIRREYKEFINFIKTAPALLLILLPLLAVLGTYLVNFYHNNVLLLILFILISLTVFFVVSDRFPRKYYPLAVFLLALSLLYQVSLISMNLWGWDIHLEYHLAQLVEVNSTWNVSIPFEYNSMMSIIMLAPIISKICNIGMVWVFKIIYPFLFALVPVGLYIIFKDETNPDVAFLACFFFISLNTFYMQMVALGRQEIAEIFLVLLLLLLLTDKIGNRKRYILLVIVTFSLAISHYALTYIFVLLILIPALILLKLSQTRILQDKLGKYIDTDSFHLSKPSFTMDVIIILLIFIFSMAWYINTSSSSPFNVFVKVINNIVASTYHGLFDPRTTQGLQILISKPLSSLHTVDKVFNIILQLFIALGLILTLFKFRKTNFRLEFLALAICSFLILLAAIIVPYFSVSLETSRFYHISLMLLSPFAVTGGVIFFEIILKYLKKWKKIPQNLNRISSLQFFTVFLVIFLLFSGGFVYAVTNDYPTSISLSQSDMNSTDLNIQVPIYNSINLFTQDIYGVRWLNQNSGDWNGTIYVDYISSHPLVSYGKIVEDYYIHRLQNDTVLKKGDFVFLGYPNTMGNILMLSVEYNSTWKTSKIQPTLDNLNKIYSNGACEIYVGNT